MNPPGSRQCVAARGPGPDIAQKKTPPGTAGGVPCKNEVTAMSSFPTPPPE